MIEDKLTIQGELYLEMVHFSDVDTSRTFREIRFRFNRPMFSISVDDMFMMHCRVINEGLERTIITGGCPHPYLSE